jgi:hypothetical protein
MLFTRNAFYFRKWYKFHEARNSDKSVDINFINTFHPIQERREKGFSNLIYGSRKNIGGFLRSSSLNVAADQQAIYELIQNADDSNSTFFSVSYNEDYLLCINNGNCFTESNMSAIINVGDSDKQGEDIGTFGIGFKILHRLLGEDDGLTAIIDEYAGPILFSWNKFFQLEKFINEEEIKVGFDEEKDRENAWLLKIIYTCFPTYLNEKIRLKDYETQSVVFTEDELREMREFLKNSLQNVNLKETNNLKNGSIFFLKLGKGKFKFINDNIENLKSGISYSFNFLNNLKKIYINGSEIRKQTLTESYAGSFNRGSEEFTKIKPRNPDRDIRFRFAYYKDYKKSANLIGSPNLYNFFSMDEEKNGFRFLLHCNAFDMNNDRRKLQPDSQINERLLPLIAKSFLAYLETKRTVLREDYLSIYATLLLSEEPINKPNINNFFFVHFKEYLQNFIPTLNGFSDDSQNVKIKSFHANLSLSELGLENIQWFYWTDKRDKELVAAAEQRLGIKEWSIRDVFVNADLIRFNEWVKNIPWKNYDEFFHELSKEYFNEEATKRIAVAKLFKFSDGEFYSLQEVKGNANLLFLSKKVSAIKNELIALGFSISELDLSRFEFYEKISSHLKSDEDIYNSIAEKTADSNNKLTATHKKNLFKCFINAETKFTGVGEEKLKHLRLFSDSTGNIKPLKELLPFNLQTPLWLNRFKIAEDEFSEFLNKFLLSENEIYKFLILPHWEEIIQEVKQAKEFYGSVSKYFSLDETNPPLTNQRFVFVKDYKDEFNFVKQEGVFFNENLLSSKNYSLLQQAIYGLTENYTPAVEIASFFTKPPFYIKNRDFCELTNEATVFEANVVNSLLEFCITNKENFFETFYLEKSDKQIFVGQRNQNTFQVTANRETRNFIEQNLSSDEARVSNAFKILPYEFTEYKNEKGILSGEQLYNLLVDSVEVDYYLDELVDIISYPEPKRKLLLQVEQFALSTQKQYTKESYEFKILDLACGKDLFNENQKELFRNKIVIETGNDSINLTDIPTSTDEISFESGKYKLSLAQILPNDFHNSDFLNTIIHQFVETGINESQLKSLFGISHEPDFKLILNLIPKEIENAQQLSFIILYHKYAEALSLKEYTVETLGKSYNLDEFNFYTKAFSFLLPDATLSEKYKGIENILTALPFEINPTQKNELLKEPYFSDVDSKFICPDINTELNDEQKLSLVEFIFKHWDKNKKTVVKAIDWSKINDTETKKLLGFNPIDSVFPNKFAISEEKLPEYILKWIDNDGEKVKFISDLKINTEDSFIISLRKFLKSGGEFQLSRIAREGNESQLFNTFNWLKENELKLKSDDAFSVFKEMVDVINIKRKEAKTGELVLEDEFDFETLKEESTELSEEYYLKWKKSLENKFSIYLFNGELPKTIQLDEVDDYIFKKYFSNDIAISDDNSIYINTLKINELKKLLSGLVIEGKLSSDELLQLYQSGDDVTRQNEISISKEDMELLATIKEIGNADEILQLAKLKEKLGGRNLAQIIEVGSQAFRNDGATFNTGNEGEKIVLADLITKFGSARVKWTSAENPNVSVPTNEYDFEIYDQSLQNVLYFVDAKSTTTKKYQTDKTEIYWRNSEWKFIEEQADSNYIIARVFNVNSNNPEIIYLKVNREEL